MLKLKASTIHSMPIELFKKIDYHTVENFNLPIALMMENAGLQLANIVACHSDLKDEILIGVGNGNNGGGGLVAARRLAAWGYKVSIDIWGEIDKELPLAELERAKNFGVGLGLETLPDVWVDAYLGFSQRLPLPDSLAERIRNANQAKSLRISLDIPVGLALDDASKRFNADIIVTLAAPKDELYSDPKARVYVADLGIPKAIYKLFGKEALPFAGSNVIQLEREVYMHQHVKSVRNSHIETLRSAKGKQNMRAFISAYAADLATSFERNERSLVIEISNYYKPMISCSEEDVFTTKLNKSEFLDIAASVHGFDNASSISDVEINQEFEKAVDCLLTGDYLELKSMLKSNPDLVNMSSQFGHKAQLVHYCASNAVELYRQVVPTNLQAMLELLLEFGAKPKNRIPVYGGEFDFFQLFSTSAHPIEAGLNKKIEEFFNY